jgi:ATP-binding cassette subfamily F protein uup
MSEGDGRFVEYAGGYTDMLAQRGQGVEARAAPKAKAPGSPAPKERRKAEPTRRKLNFGEQHELKSLPARMAEVEKDIAALHAKLSDATFYARDPDGFAVLSEKLAGAQAALTATESRWLELEMLREELERQ